MISAIETPSRFRLTYAFELVTTDGRAGANRVLNFPVNPEHIHVSAAAGAEATYTAGGVVLEESGFVAREVTVGGTVGLEAKRGWRLESEAPDNPTTGMATLDGKDLHRELLKWFEFYWRMKRDAETSTTWMMVFHDFRLGHHWLILPQGFDSRRDAKEHRLHYPYEIRFRAVADWDALRPTGLMGFFSDVRDVGDKVRNALLSVSGYIADAEAAIVELDQAAAGSVRASIGALQAMADAVAGVASGIRNAANGSLLLVDLARNAVQGVMDEMARLMGLDEDGGVVGEVWTQHNSKASLAAAVRSAASAAERACDTIASMRRVWQRSLGDVSTSRAALEAGEGGLSVEEASAGSTVSLGARATPGSAIRRGARIVRPRRKGYTGTRAYVVQDGDTIRRVAVAEVGDAEAWYDIAAINGLRAPYFSPTGMPDTVRAGDQIMLPTTGAGGATAGARMDMGAIEELALGTDFELSGGDLVVDAQGTGFRLVSGLACFRQGLDIRLGTTLGENPVYPSVGIYAPVGERGGAGMTAAVAMGVRRACFTDPRTHYVVDLKISDAGDAVAVEVTVQPRASLGPVVVEKESPG